MRYGAELQGFVAALTSVAVPLSGKTAEVMLFGSPVNDAVTVPRMAPIVVGAKTTLKRHV